MAWAPAYVTPDDLKSYLYVGDTLDDVQLASAAEAASRAVDEQCHRQFGKLDEPAPRRYTARLECGRWVVDIDDLMSTTGLAVAVPAGPVMHELEPVNAAADGRPWTRLVVAAGSPNMPSGADHEVTVTALWGWAAVPVAVKQATLLQASRFAARRQSPYGVAGSPSDGSEVRLLARVDPDVAVILAPYVRRQWVFA
ncbi:phage gp6-like head-tail connector protein [Micromonospora globbae]|uniref:Phage gp6-like head-tail connector protein n=1 Tax=Micromonospora globbae TaxID=1894969 RepID=A0A420ETY7_9ACTN|nr:phage gp6-like head-tail connector protein [Micromonospora globbae]RKF24137.1 phage gp6-like head-tail connector protein [Micromonospora globbae]